VVLALALAAIVIAAGWLFLGRGSERRSAPSVADDTAATEPPAPPPPPAIARDIARPPAPPAREHVPAHDGDPNPPGAPAHPITPQHQRIFAENRIAFALDDATDAKDVGVMKDLLSALQAKHPIVGATRSIGLFGIVELVKDRDSMEPLAPFNGTSDAMKKLGRFFRQEGLYTFVRMNTFFTNPPLTITDEELRHGFDIIDRALSAIG